MYLISACLVGVKCRYDGNNNLDMDIVKLLEEGKAIAICPEVLGGLPTPREPCEIVRTESGDIKILGRSGTDFTHQFTEGAKKTLEICNIVGIDKAILKSRSPSCGYESIYDGTFSGRTIDGNGVVADLLKRNGIAVFNEDNWK